MSRIAVGLVFLLLPLSASLHAQRGDLPVPENYLRNLVEQGAVERLQPVQDDTLRHVGADLARGWLLYGRDRNFTVFPNSRPSPDESIRVLRLRATPGEIESVQFAAYALRDIAKLSVSGRVTASGVSAWLEKGAVVEDVLFHPVQYRLPEHPRWPTLSYVRYPTFIRPAAGYPVPQGESRLYWVTVTVPAGTPAGTYRATVRLSDDSGVSLELPLEVEVLPFALTDKGLPRFGSFLSGAPFAPGEWRFMKRYGFDGLQWFWGANPIRISNVNGEMQLDFSRFDAFVKGMLEAGMKGPLVLTLGNSWLGQYEIALAGVFGLKLNESMIEGRMCTIWDYTDPRWEKYWVEGLRRIFAHARSAGWPLEALLIHDEPTKHLMAYHQYKYDLVKKHFPEMPVYGVFFEPQKDPGPLLKSCDIVVANRDLARMSALAKLHGKRFWSYINVCADQSFGVSRMLYGQIPAYYGSEVMFFWCWNYWIGNPWDDFDGYGENVGGPAQSDADWVAVYPSVDGNEPVRTLAVEAAREAIDDVRYIRTLEQRLESDPARKAAVMSEIRRMQAAMFDGIDQDMRIYRDSDFFTTASNDDVERLRDYVISEILKTVR